MSENLSSPIVFDSIEPVVVPVSVAGVDYELREASGGAATKYRDASMACFTLGPQGKPVKITNMAGVESFLVSLCLYDSKNILVKQTLIQSWPSRIQKKLFERAKKISDLDEGGDLKELILKAFQRPDSPVSLQDVRKWIASLEDTDEEEWKPLKELFEMTPEEKAKNEQAGIPVGAE